jgi:hypothetical protein
VIALLGLWAAAEAAETRVVASLVIAVSQKEEAADAAVDQAEKLGGYFQARTPQHVSLRVPVTQGEALVEAISLQGKVLDRSLSRDDLSQQLADLRARLKAREEVLARYDAVLEKASAKSIVSVEHQIMQAIQQIELLKGQIRMLESQASMAAVDVSFQFRDRQAPVNDGSSSFAWLNSLDVQNVIAALRTDLPEWKTKADIPEVPDGFSAWKDERAFRAASPDGILVRARTEPHEPEADLAFWTEAARARMTAAGYKLVAEEPIEASGTPGTLLELAAPVGTEDWTFIVAFVPAGRKILVVEIAGEVSTVGAQRSALLAWLGGIRA